MSGHSVWLRRGLWLKRGLVAGVLLALAWVLPATLEAQPEPLAVVPIGDSITEGDAQRLSYRYPLWAALLDDGIALDLVGSLATDFGEGSPPEHHGVPFDPDHEARSGWRTDQVLAVLPSTLQGYEADVALVHLGTNDILQGQSNASTVAELGLVIDALRADDPDVTVLLAQILPIGFSPYADQVPDLNGRIAQLAAAKTTASSPVFVVDQFTGFSPLTDTSDGIHPNPEGEAKMAQRWRATVLALPVSPRVAAFAPAPGAADVSAEAAISVTFDRPMAPASLEGALTVTAAGAALDGVVTYQAETYTATFVPAQSLPAGAEVRVRLAGPGGATGATGGHLAGDYTWSFTVAAPAASGTYYHLGDLEPTFVANGWGPLEIDMNVGEQPAGDGGPLRLNGVTYERGLGSHSPAEIRYALGGACTRFLSDVGLDDAMDGTGGSVEFQVWTDGVQGFDSGVMRYYSETQTVDLDVSGAQELRLVVTEGGDNNWWDWANWADARLDCTAEPAPAPDTTPPSVLAATPADGTLGVATEAAPTLRFDEDVDPDTLGLLRIETVEGAPVPLDLTYDSATAAVTLTPATALEPDTTYRVTVEGVRDLAGNQMAEGVTWTFTTAPPQVAHYLSDLTWTSAVNGWGPVELDMNVGEQPAGDGGPLVLNGVTYPKGLGVHANSDVRYDLGESCTRFLAHVGVDDAMDGTGASIRFQVWADGVLAFDSGVMWADSPTQSVDLPMEGVTELRLVLTDGGDQVWWDWGNWADARVSCSE